GLGAPIGFGEAVPNVAGPEQTLLDEVELSIDPALPDPAPVTSYAVPEPLDVVRLRSTDAPLIVVGDGEGLVDAAAADALDLDRTVLFGADLAADDELRVDATSSPAEIVITDTNRRRARLWGTLRENVGLTELAGTEPLVFDPGDNRLPVFPAAATTPGLDVDDTRTVAVHLDGPEVTASRFGNPVTYALDDRPVHAADGDLTTAWTVAAFDEGRGEFLRYDFGAPITIDSLRAVQPLGEANRHITEIELRADGAVRTIDLTSASWLPEGETVSFDSLTGSVFDIVITDLDVPVLATYPVGTSPVGFAELTLGSTSPTSEWIRTPRALVDRLGDGLDDHGLTVVLTRERSDPQEPVRETPEAVMRRLVPLPTDRTFAITGTVRLDPSVAPDRIDAFLGRTDESLVVTSTGALEGNLLAVPSAMFDGDPSTRFVGRFDDQVGQAWRVRSDTPFEIDGIELDIVVGPRHSSPTTVVVAVDDVGVGRFPTGISPSEEERVETITLPVAAASATTVRIEIAASDDRVTRDWYSNALISMPVAIAEMRVGGLGVADAGPVDTGCIEGLVRIEGRDVAVRITGDAAAARRGDALALVGCDEVSVPAGDVAIDATGDTLPLTVDQLVLRSERDVAAAEDQPELTPTWHSDVRVTVDVPAGGADRWFVLGQSHNLGWTATIDGVALGEPTLVDGFANGWRIPGDGGTVELVWTPQRLVDRALVFSVVAIVLIATLALRPAPTPVARTTAPVPVLLDPPRRGVRRPTRVAVVTALMTALFAAVNLPTWPPAVVVVGGVAALSVRRIEGARVPAGLAAGLFAITSLLIMAEQVLERHPPGFIWPQQFDEFHVLGVVTILLLAVEYVRCAVAPDDR
ncbi:MAG: hypothetical protein AAF081_18645, partial [Actinomycetota bacterium]